MTNAPNSGNDPGTSRSNRRLRMILVRISIALGITTLVGIVGGAWFAWIFVHQRLAPIVQADLTKTLKRPVQLGKVESFWITSLRFGSSSLPPTPTDPDTAAVAAVEVGFNPLQLLLTRTLKLDITLVKPNLYLEQDKQGRWITISVEPKPEEGGIKTEVETVQVKNADAVLVPFPKPGNQKLPIKFAQIDGGAQLSEEGKRIRFQLAGQAASGGNFKVEGDSHLTTPQETTLLVQGQNLVAADIGRLLKLPSLELTAGFLDASLGVQLAGTQLTSFSGTAGLKEVAVQIPQLPKPLTRTNGTLSFQGTQIHLDNVSSFYDQVPAVAAGTFDTKAGFNIKVATAPVTLKAILQTFNVKQLPIAVIGEVKADLQLMGTPQKPMITGSAVNTKLTRIDKLNIKALSTNFELVGSTLTIKNFQAQPSVGGRVDGSGEARLGKNGSIAVGFQAQELPGDAIAGVYGATNLPIRVGRLSGQGRVEGTLGNIETVVHWNAPNATYPATGEVAISPNGTASLRNTNIQVAGGTVTGTGQLYPKEGTLQASFQASGVQGQGLAPLLKRQLPPQLQGPISGIVNVAGNIHSLTPETIHATGSAAVSVAGGTVRANDINLNAGRFTAGVTLAGVQLGQLIPQGNLKLQAPVNGAFNVAGNLVKNNEQSAIAAKASGQLNLGGGTVTVSSLNLDQDRFRAAVQANDVNVGSLSPQVPPPLRGHLNGNFDLAGNLNNLQLAAIQGGGSGSLRVDGGTITANNVNLASGGFSADLQANNLQVANLTPQLPPQLRGRLNGTFNVKGSLETGKGAPPLLATIQGSGSGSLDVGGGTVKASQVNVQAGRFNAAVQASDVRVSSLAPQLPSLRGSRLNGNLYLEGNLDNPQLAAIQGSGSGILSNVGGGRVTASNIDLNAGRFSASVEASGVQVGSLIPQAPPTVRRGSLNGIFDVAGSLNNLQLSAIQARGSGSLNHLAGGTLAASSVSLNAGRFEVGVRLDKVALSPFSSQLRGNVTGDLNLSGTLTALTPSDIQADGNLNFSQGVSSIEKPLTTAFSWDGQNLQIQQVSAPGLQANGVVSFARVNSLVVPPITSFNLNATAQDLNLQKLPITLPNLQLAGLLDFNGSLSGTPSAPTVIGNNVRLRNLIVNGLAFDPDLSGSVRLQAGKGGNIQLRGIQDRIELAVAPNNQPTSFLVNVGLRSVNAANTQGQQPAPRIVANGRKQGDQLLVDVQSLPLGPLQKLAPSNVLAQLPPTISAQPVAGNLSGNFVITFGKGGVFTLPSSIAANNIAIANPGLGNIKGDQVTVGSFSFTEGNLNVSNAEFQQGQTKYALSGSLNQNPGPGNFQAQVKVAQGNIQDILAAASINDIQDLTRGFGQAPVYGTASDVRVQAVGNPQDPLLLQLRRLVEIKAYQDRLRVAQEASPIPELRDLAGTFSGEVNIAGSLKQGFTPDFNTLNVNFDLDGANWNWGNRYTANQVIARGTLQNGILTLLPLQFDSGNTVVAFTGNVGGEQQTGQLRVRNLPVDQLQQIFNLPINITGSLNADANLAGSVKNPLARGEATLSNGLLNGAPVQQAQASFNYANARLNFSSNVLVAAGQGGVGSASPSSSPTPNPPPPATQPINIVGNIPYKLPFAERLPDSNDIALTLSMQDQGFALLGALTRGQVAWVNGSGQVQVNVTGSIDPKTNTIQRLRARGMANIANATVKSQVLPDPLTGVTGKAMFGLNGVRVESFQAKYGNGLITALGGLPISNSDLKAKNPLQVNIGDLAVNLKGLYSGGVKGNVQVTGTALAPRLGGEVQLSNGTVQIPAEQIVSATTGGGGSSGSSNALASNPIEFNNLDLVLGKGVQVTLSPLFNFLADGQLIVNGTQDNIQPAGTVTLRRGQVNLFTTQFRLDRGYPQTATFFPDQGLIPNLDVRLTAAVVESSGSSRLPIGTDAGNSSDRTYNDEVALRNLFAPLGEVREDIPGLYTDSVGTVRIQARVLGAANQLSQTLQLTSTPPRSESEIIALLGGGFVQTLGSGDSTLGLANFAGSALLGNVQNVIGDALGLSEFRLFPYLDPNPKNRSSSTLDLAAEVGFDLNRRLSATVLKVLTANTQSSAQVGLLYRVNDKIILRGSTDLSSDNRAEVEYQTRF